MKWNFYMLTIYRVSENHLEHSRTLREIKKYHQNSYEKKQKFVITLGTGVLKKEVSEQRKYVFFKEKTE